MHPIYERISSICKERGTSITALCLEITGSKGNLATWKKGKIYLDDLIAIKEKLNISIDNILVEKNPLPLQRMTSDFISIDEIKGLLAENNSVDYVAKIYKVLEQRQQMYVLVWLIEYAISEGLPVKQVLGI